MSPPQVRSLCTAAGITLSLSNHHMGYKLLASPRSAITSQISALLTKYRDALVDLLYTEWRDSIWPPVDINTPAIRWACSLSDQEELEI